MISRRAFLRDISLVTLATGAAPVIVTRAAARDVAETVAGKEGMLIRSFRFLDLEMPMNFLDSWVTPVPHFFVRNHMFEPTTLETGEWRLNVGGEVEKPLALSLADLSRMETDSVVNTLECAGNGRGFQNPKVPGIQWQRGAVGTARFAGCRLRAVLERAGVKPTGKHVMFRGLDEVPGKVPPFIRSIPIEKAMDRDTLIATHMNDAPLTKHHGFPARALVPGWVGAASCKWLAEIKVLGNEFEGNFMKPGYRWPNHPVEPGGSVNPDDTHALTALTVKSIIASPADGTSLSTGTVRIHGAAWAGEADVVRVEISTDAGTSWKPAQLGGVRAHYAWRLWSYPFRAIKPGEYTIMSRATDSQGRVQPANAIWNPSGYLYNAFDQVKIHVQA